MEQSEQKHTLKDVLGERKAVKFYVDLESVRFILSALADITTGNLAAMLMGGMNRKGQYLAAKNCLRLDIAMHKQYGCDDPQCFLKTNVFAYQREFAAEISKDEAPIDLII